MSRKKNGLTERRRAAVNPPCNPERGGMARNRQGKKKGEKKRERTKRRETAPDGGLQHASERKKEKGG